VKNTYSSVIKLEIRLKVALSLYLFFILSGGIILSFGLESVLHYSEMPQPGFFFLVCLIVLILFIVTIFNMNRIHWLSNVHMWLDNRFFGFLKRSNDTILNSLLSTISFEEQKTVGALEPKKRDSIQKSIIAALSNDSMLHQQLLQSNIFPTWTFYWITLYGSLTFTLLTIAAFVALILNTGEHNKILFASYWGMAVLHILTAIIIGFRTVIMSKATMKDIVETHREEISAILTENKK
jgi:hypothetical protein